MKTITPGDLKGWQRNAKFFLLLDVREDWEHIAFNIGGINIPLGDIMARKSELSLETPLVIYCEKGIRSAIAIQRLEQLGYSNLYNLEGGIAAWKKAQ